MSDDNKEKREMKFYTEDDNYYAHRPDEKKMYSQPVPRKRPEVNTKQIQCAHCGRKFMPINSSVKHCDPCSLKVR